MLPFCGYNMADYFGHWLTFSERFERRDAAQDLLRELVPQGPDGRWLWPGFGENSRVLEWIFDRTAGRGEAEETVIGLRAHHDALNIEGLDVTPRRHGRTTHRR
jgi:phosphoenolpyruvate carboxykinase (GTP)